MDTDVIAAALLSEPLTGKEAGRLLGDSRQLFAPAHWKAELSNVVWKAVRLGRLELAAVDEVLSAAEVLPIVSVDVGELWRGAVARAVATLHPAYDTLFVELAVRLRTYVASYDRPLHNRFPEYVRHPGEILGPRAR